MSVRSKAALRILEAAANLQWSVAEMLEAKASEMESLRDWVTDTVRWSNVKDQNAFVLRSCDFHGILIEVIQGVTRMESGLASHLNELIVEEEVLGDNAFSTTGGVMPAGGDGL